MCLSLESVGVLIGSADSSFVMATHPTIASEFNALGSSSWLFTGFTLAAAATGNTVRFPTRQAHVPKFSPDRYDDVSFESRTCC